MNSPRSQPAGGSQRGHQAAKSKATRDKIINAVIGIIKESGYAAASSTRIAKRAGITWGAVQHHFGGKDEILEQVLDRSHQTFQARLSDPHFTTGSADTRVRKYVEAAWQHYQGDEYMASLEILLATRGHGNTDKDLAISRTREEHVSLGRQIFHDSEAGDQQLQQAIYCVHCMLTGILVETALEPVSFATQPYIEHLQSLLKRILY
ncbi:MAG: TetR/AcrR family transcriptional regulator [Gammaproteobacteria bacterium]|nr:TetR/AcrR family transcriptional regulator [Gammaproteobacteria bacterium]